MAFCGADGGVSRQGGKRRETRETQEGGKRGKRGLGRKRGQGGKTRQRLETRETQATREGCGVDRRASETLDGKGDPVYRLKGPRLVDSTMTRAEVRACWTLDGKGDPVYRPRKAYPSTRKGKVVGGELPSS